jgi:hypothetical protein
VVFKERKYKTRTEKAKALKDKIPTDWNKVIQDITVKITGFATLWALLKQ